MKTHAEILAAHTSLRNRLAGLSLAELENAAVFTPHKDRPYGASYWGVRVELEMLGVSRNYLPKSRSQAGAVEAARLALRSDLASMSLSLATETPDNREVVALTNLLRK